MGMKSIWVSSTRMGDLLGSPRERVSYLVYPNLFGTKGLVKVKVQIAGQSSFKEPSTELHWLTAHH